MTDQVLAGLAGHSAIKYMMEFGNVAPHLRYEMMSAHLDPRTTKPNKTCPDGACRQAQAALQEMKARQVENENSKRMLILQRRGSRRKSGVRKQSLV